MDWIEKYYGYIDFLDLEEFNKAKTQEEAKKYLEDVLEMMLCMNGIQNMRDFEIQWMKELGMKI